MLVFIIVVLAHIQPKSADIENDAFICTEPPEETAIAPISEHFQETGMPCEIYDRKLATELATTCNRLATNKALGNAENVLQRIERSVNEPQADEKELYCGETAVAEAGYSGDEVSVQNEAPVAAEVQVVLPDNPVETVCETESSSSDVPSEIPSIAGILQAELEKSGIGWWYPYGYAQMMQESHGNQWAVSADGQDYGIFQYRLRYWTEPESIFDVNAQIRRYVSEVYARISAGLSIEEIISRHFTSDYVTEINWQYVNDVLQHLN